MREMLFCGLIASLLAYDILLIVSIARPELRFWPPPERPSWRHEVMRVAGFPSQGLGGPLLASGAYRYSRNPQYVGAISGLIGYSLICNSALALIAWILWSSWYLLAPVAEEPWLRERLGAAYTEYASQVRRFL